MVHFFHRQKYRIKKRSECRAQGGRRGSHACATLTPVVLRGRDATVSFVARPPSAAVRTRGTLVRTPFVRRRPRGYARRFDSRSRRAPTFEADACLLRVSRSRLRRSSRINSSTARERGVVVNLAKFEFSTSASDMPARSY